MRGKGSERNDKGGRPSSISMKATLKQDVHGAARNSRYRSRVHIPSTLESLGTLCNDAASNGISAKKKTFADKKRQARDVSSNGGNHSTIDAVAVVSPPSTPEDDRNKTPTTKQQSRIIDTSFKQIDPPCIDIDDFFVDEKVIELLGDDDEVSENEQPKKQQRSYSDDDSSILEVYSICSGESAIDISDDDDGNNGITGGTMPDEGFRSFLGKEKPPTKENNNLETNRASEETNYWRSSNKFPKADAEDKPKKSPSIDTTMQHTMSDPYYADDDDAYYSSGEEETVVTSVHRSMKHKAKYRKNKKPSYPNKKEYSPKRSSWKTETNNKSEKEMEYSDEEENVTARSHWSMRGKLKHHQEKKQSCSDEEDSVTAMRYRTIINRSKRNQERKSGYRDSDSNTQKSMKNEKSKKQSGCLSDEHNVTATSVHSRRSKVKRRKRDEKDSGCSSSDTDDYKPFASSSSDDNMTSVDRKKTRNNRRQPKKNELSDDDDDYEPSGKRKFDRKTSKGKRNEYVDSSEEDTAMINYMPSPYEQFRNEKVRRNQEYLASLGLFKIKEDLIGPSSSRKNRIKEAKNESFTLSSKETAFDDAKSPRRERRHTKRSCQNSICDSLAAIGCENNKKSVNTKGNSKGGNDNTAPWRSEVKESLLHINEVQQEIRKEQNSCFFYARSGELNKSYRKLKNTKKSMYNVFEKSLFTPTEPDELLDYTNEHYEQGISQKKLNAKRGAVGKLQRCMQCVACLRIDDCLQCTYCRARNDPHKKNSRKCALRRCVAPLPPLIHKDDDKEESLEVCRNILSTKKSSLFGEALLKTDVKALFGNQNLSAYRLLPPGTISDGTSTGAPQQTSIVIEHPMPKVRAPLSLDPDEQSLSDGIVLEDIEENDGNYKPVTGISEPLLQEKVAYPYEEEAINPKTLFKKVENGPSFEQSFRNGEINKPFELYKAMSTGKLVNDAEQHIPFTTYFASIDEINRPLFHNKIKSPCEQQIIDQESLQPKNCALLFDGKYIPRNKTGADFARGLLSFQRSLLHTEKEDEDFPEDDTYNLLVV